MEDLIVISEDNYSQLLSLNYGLNGTVVMSYEPPYVIICLVLFEYV
jgi:hypothetical protein